MHDSSAVVLFFFFRKCAVHGLNCCECRNVRAQAMEILDIPEKLQQAILNPDKRLTVDLRVRQYCLPAGMSSMFAQYKALLPHIWWRKEQ